jgi:hypothetical protein
MSRKFFSVSALSAESRRSTLNMRPFVPGRPPRVVRPAALAEGNGGSVVEIVHLTMFTASATAAAVQM